MECIITVDIGTSSTRVVAFDFAGNEIAYKKGSYPTFHPHADWSEQDPEQVYITLLFILKSIVNDSSFQKSYSIKAIVLSSAMHSVLPIDSAGNPLGNAIIWADNRADKIANELKYSELGQSIYKNTGTPIHAMSPLAKISWLKQNEPAKFEKTSRFISLKEYVIFQLTNEFYVDYSIASATGFFNLKNLEWEEQSLSFAGVDKSYFSKAVPIYYDKLQIKESIMKSLKLDKNTRLIIGSSDGCLATLSSGAVNKREAVVSITSSGAVRMFGSEFLTDNSGSFFNYILDNNLFVSGGPTSNGGVAYEWAVRNFCLDKSMEYEDAMDKITNEATKVAAGSSGLIFLPYLQGERAPIWNSDARAMYFGMNITHEPPHFIRAAIEGIVFEIYSIGNSIIQHRKIESLHLNGEYASTNLWSQIICDVFGLPVNVSGYKQSQNLGAAMLGLTQLGVFKNLEAANSILPRNTELNPSKSKNKVYNQIYRIFDSLTNKLAAEFKAISDIQNEH